ncbi:Hypothetical_protein [Hexamita inflata]|uniref:Hypothetical_protein n=1 Tax=Hexamita inflata TaxID=28002 RepID=A0AA86Q925_9EUKA|nr:Hypothetical protein HINF_LOCUS39312 [Hexamita inflata]
MIQLDDKQQQLKELQQQKGFCLNNWIILIQKLHQQQYSCIFDNYTFKLNTQYQQSINCKPKKVELSFASVISEIANEISSEFSYYTGSESDNEQRIVDEDFDEIQEVICDEPVQIIQNQQEFKYNQRIQPPKQIIYIRQEQKEVIKNQMHKLKVQVQADEQEIQEMLHKLVGSNIRLNIRK